MDDLDERLRAVVTAHVVIGGYPDTMGIAREAYRMARRDMARHGVMFIERTTWRDGMPHAERRDLEAWLEQATQADMAVLLDDAIEIVDDETQHRLGAIWDAATRANGMTEEPGEYATHHWGEVDRIALRRTLARLRPDIADPDPDQGSLL